FSRVADHQEAKVCRTLETFRIHGEHLLIRDALASIVLLDRQDHLLAPGVGARLGPTIPNSRGPGLAVEEPAKTPDRNNGDQNRRERQSHLQTPVQCRQRRGTSLGQPPRKAHSTDKPPSRKPSS